MHFGTIASSRRHRITKTNFKSHGEFENLGESHLKYDCCEHGNEQVIVVRTSSVILSLLLISCTGNKLQLANFTKYRVFQTMMLRKFS